MKIGPQYVAHVTLFRMQQPLSHGTVLNICQAFVSGHQSQVRLAVHFVATTLEFFQIHVGALHDAVNELSPSADYLNPFGRQAQRGQ